MKLFLTSTIGGSYRDGDIKYSCKLREDNGLVDRIKENWPDSAKCLLFSASPGEIDFNDSMKELYAGAFGLSGLAASAFDLCDNRNGHLLGEMIRQYNVLIFSGGSIIEEQNFFERIGLKEYLEQFSGIIITISAGSMNSADHVYTVPEAENIPVLSQKDRYLKGLGLTDISIIPHFQRIQQPVDKIYGGLLDVLLADSRVREFYGLPDGSYLVIEEEQTILYGEAYYLHDGLMEQVCQNNSCIKIKTL